MTRLLEEIYQLRSAYLHDVQSYSVSSIVGMGHDVVQCSSFAEQLSMPGSRFERCFSAREIAQCKARAQASHDDYVVHMAARWAGKEAFLKAWSHALGALGITEMPYSIENFPWAEIEIVHDNAGRPHITLTDRLSDTLHKTIVDQAQNSVNSGILATHDTGQNIAIHISLSHDGDIASAVVIMEHTK